MLIKLRFIILTIILTFVTTPILHAQKKQTSLKKEVDKMCSLLQHPYEHMRGLAVEKLVSIGPAVSPYLAKKYFRYNYLARRKVIEVWQNIGDDQSINYIFNAMNDVDEGVRMQAAIALLELSDVQNNIVIKLKNLVPKNRREQNTIQEIIDTLSFKEVERELARLISPDGGYSYATSQYQEIRKLGNRAVRPLLSIFTEDNYRFIHYRFAQDYLLGNKMRILAGQALAEMQDMISDIERVIVLDRLHKTCFNKDPDIRREVACILKQFGDSSFWKTIIDHDKKYIWDHPGDVDLPYHLGMMFFRVGRNYQAVEYFERTVLLNPHDSLAHYRLACTYARRNLNDKAMISLEKAFQQGFHDYVWVKNEPDLVSLHNHPKFSGFLQKMEQTYLHYLLESKKTRGN